MVTEKQIEKHRFFTTDGTDIWKANEIKAVEMFNCETQDAVICVLGEEMAKKYHPVRMPVVKKQKSEGGKQRAEGGGRKAKAKTKTAAKAERTRRGCRAGSPPSSKYFGVTIKTNKKGEKRFYAQVTKKGKWKNLGCHMTEELAAAAVAEYLGNTKEAKRLRKLAESETDSEIKKLKPDNTAYDCTGCGAQYKYRPDMCGKCGGGAFAPALSEK